MSGKKSLLVDKSKMPLAMGIAFVAFTTQTRDLVFRLRRADLSVLYQLWNLVSDPSGADTGSVLYIFLVRHALRLQT